MDVKEIVKGFIIQNFMHGEQSITIDDETSFIDGGIIDSIGVLELVAFIEEKFGFRVEDEELVPDNLDSINKIFAYVNSKLAVKSPQL